MLRKHSSTDPNCVPIVSPGTLREHWLAVNACNWANPGVNYGNSLLAATQLVSLTQIESG